MCFYDKPNRITCIEVTELCNHDYIISEIQRHLPNQSVVIDFFDLSSDIIIPNSPDTSLGGQLKKKWQIINNKRVLIKDARKKVEDMLLLDFIMGNIDRHFNNFGIIRDADTLEFLDTSPIFDMGSSLGFNKVASFFDIDKNDEINSFQLDEFTQFKLIKGNYNLTPLNTICE